MTRSILVFSAHPDDEILGVGGTLQQYQAAGYRIAVCLVTDGSSTQYPNQPGLWQQKQQEYQNALDLLSVDQLIELKYPDMRLDTVSHAEVCRRLTEIVHTVQPEIVFTPSDADLNRDHREVYRASLVACRPVAYLIKALYSYEVLSSSEWMREAPFSPNYFVPLTENQLRRKQQALALMPTEVRPYPHPRSPEGIAILAQYRGLQCGAKFAEAFRLICSYAP
ncbi:MAG: PIG-L family deacetylase [Candidatus Magasanikbacteria bacterium]|nr:PIG-L family deacetylase [Candidatus Magasanikbacteria bacterium]